MAGSVCDGVPSVNSAEFELSDCSVTLVCAVSVSVPSLVLPIEVGGSVTAGPVSAWLTGAPNAITDPSRVPTYSRPSPTPGTL